MRALLLQLLALAAGAALAWPVDSGSDRWQPYQRPELLQVISMGDRVSANLQSAAGRLLVKGEVQLVLRDVDRATELSLTASRGRLQLELGDGAARLAVTGAGLELSAGKQRDTWRPPEGLEDWRDGTVSLTVTDGAVVGRRDGEVLVGPVSIDRPAGRALVHAWPGASFAELCGTRASGELVVIASPSEQMGWGRTVWGALAAWLALVSMRAWWQCRRSEEGTCAPGVRPLALGILLALAVGPWVSLGQRNAERLAAPAGSVSSEDWSLAVPTAVVPGKPLDLHPRRDADARWRLTVRLGADSVLDVLLRASPPGQDRAVLVSLSSDAQMPCGLVCNLGTRVWSVPGPDAPIILGAELDHELDVRAEGERIVVRVDGTLLGVLEDLDLRAGRTALHVLRGRAEVLAMSIEPSGPPEELPGVLRAWRLEVLAWVFGALLVVSLVCGSSARVVLWAWPLALAAWVPAPGWAPTAAGIAAVLLAALGGGSGRRWLVRVLGAVALAVTLHEAATRAPPAFSPAVLNGLNLADVAGPPWPERYLWARHPLCRRFNEYCKTQTFRSGAARSLPPAGRRIITLGSSSTFGYGVGASQTWSALLERRLGPGVEVINAGVNGGHAARLAPYLEHVLLPLEPDVVVISLSYNDHIQGGRGYDEAAHMQAMVTTGVGPLGVLRERWSGWWNERRWHRFRNAERNGEAVDAAERESCEAEPARRFELIIEVMVTAAQQAGAEVVLMQEPFRPGEQLPGLSAHHGALQRVAEAHGCALVSPQGALDELGASAFVDIVHPNEAGHRSVARELAGPVRALLER